MIEVNRYRKIYAIKYYILAAMIAMASLWMIPTALSAPGQDLRGLQRPRDCVRRGVGARLRRDRRGHRRRRPRSTSGATARFKSACSTRSR